MDFANSVISWNVANIHGLLGNKTEDPEFLKIITSHDIICLQETGCEVSLRGYKSYSSIRKTGRGGGVTTLVKDSLLQYCSVVDNQLTKDHSMNMAIVKLTNPGTKTHTFVVNSNVPPAKSKRKISPTTPKPISMLFRQELAIYVKAQMTNFYSLEISTLGLVHQATFSYMTELKNLSCSPTQDDPPKLWTFLMTCPSHITGGVKTKARIVIKSFFLISVGQKTYLF